MQEVASRRMERVSLNVRLLRERLAVATFHSPKRNDIACKTKENQRFYRALRCKSGEFSRVSPHVDLAKCNARSNTNEISDSIGQGCTVSSALTSFRCDLFRSW